MGHYHLYFLFKTQVSCYWDQSEFVCRPLSLTFLRLPWSGVWRCCWWLWQGEVCWHNCVSCSVYCTSWAMFKCFIIFTSSSLRLRVEPVWLVTGARTTPFHFSQDNILFGALVGSSTVRWCVYVPPLQSDNYFLIISADFSNTFLWI